jgi:hypothetical protein
MIETAAALLGDRDGAQQDGLAGSTKPFHGIDEQHMGLVLHIAQQVETGQPSIYDANR